MHEKLGAIVVNTNNSLFICCITNVNSKQKHIRKNMTRIIIVWKGLGYRLGKSKITEYSSVAINLSRQIRGENWFQWQGIHYIWLEWLHSVRLQHPLIDKVSAINLPYSFKFGEVYTVCQNLLWGMIPNAKYIYFICIFVKDWRRKTKILLFLVKIFMAHSLFWRKTNSQKCLLTKTILI